MSIKKGKRLLDEVKDIMRLKHYSITYCQIVVRQWDSHKELEPFNKEIKGRIPGTPYLILGIFTFLLWSLRGLGSGIGGIGVMEGLGSHLDL